MPALTASQAFATALQHHQAGRLSEAESLYRQVLAAQPNHADALHFLGVIAQEVGRHDLAVELISQSLVLSPNNAAAYFSRGCSYHSLGRVDEAVAEYRRALVLQPDLAEAHNNLGNALRERGQLEEAVTAFRQALQLKPNFAEVCNNLGVALTKRGQFDEAVATLQRALQLKPDFPEACNNLGVALTQQGQFDEAVAAFRRALQLRPNYPDAFNNMGGTLTDQGKADEAVTAFRRALQLNPNYPDAHYNLGNALREKCELEEAMAAYHRALDLDPGLIDAHSNLLQTALYLPVFGSHALREERNRWNRQYAQPLPRQIHRHDTPDPARTLRIGYVSSDFQDNVIGRYLVPLFHCHDRQQFEILCYSGAMQPDELTDEFRQHSSQWRTTRGLADEVLAEMIRHDEVDILVDLTLHAPRNRLLVFARQPAPIQVSFAGYPASTGLETIGYRISDRFLEKESDDTATEAKERVCLMNSNWCFDPCGIDLPTNALPAEVEGLVTFGCLNSFWKINEPHLRLWARILRETGESRLMLLGRPGNRRQWTLDFLERAGIDPRRVEFAERRPRRAYLELYHRVDIALDPFPYNGHSTSLDALWMGVPIVSLAGEQAVSRAGLSQLSNLGLPELAAFSEEDYVRIAVKLAMDLPRLAELRATLRQRMEASPLMDARDFARNVEAAYRTMWREWCEEAEIR